MQWRSQEGPRGPSPPQTFGKCFFSPINLCCYVLLMCKWLQVALTNVFQADNIKNTSPNVISPTFFFALGSTHDSTDCWNAHRSPAARESCKCVQGWVASAGWHRPGGIDRVALAGWPTPQTKILATPVPRWPIPKCNEAVLTSMCHWAHSR